MNNQTLNQSGTVLGLMDPAGQPIRFDRPGMRNRDRPSHYYLQRAKWYYTLARLAALMFWLPIEWRNNLADGIEHDGDGWLLAAGDAAAEPLF